MVSGTGAWFAFLLQTTDALLKTLGTEPKTGTLSTCLKGEIGHCPPGTGVLGFASLLHSTGTYLKTLGTGAWRFDFLLQNTGT
jgi:hypothetical protein